MLWRLRRWWHDWQHDLRAARGSYVTAGTLGRLQSYTEDWRRVAGER